MKKLEKVMIGMAFILMPVSLAGQDWTEKTYRHQYSSVPDTARYEIVQSELGVRYTFKVDKYTGKVYQLAENDNEDLLWEPILLMDLLMQDEAAMNKVNYQLFTSGSGVRYTFLLNVNTGEAWQLTEDPEPGILIWSAIE